MKIKNLIPFSIFPFYEKIYRALAQAILLILQSAYILLHLYLEINLIVFYHLFLD